jgi:probable rRNA maturation factor
LTYLANLQRRVKVPLRRVRKLAGRIMGNRDLSLAFVTDAAIRKLNRKFLGHDYVTDVLAFRLDGEVFGEVVVSPAYAAREAKVRAIPVEEEILRYVAHGCLHLLGYDDHRPGDRKRMWERQERELRRFLSPPRRS